LTPEVKSHSEGVNLRLSEFSRIFAGRGHFANSFAVDLSVNFFDTCPKPRLRLLASGLNLIEAGIFVGNGHLRK
jgi:hypothetical protein